MCEKDYLNSNPKVVIILKEANAPDGDSNLIDQLKNGVGYNIWCNVARWVYGIRNRDNMPKWADFQCDIQRPEFRKNLFKSIGTINLKKSPGGSSANDSEIEKIAREDYNLIRRQYNLYDPDLTICGGTDDLFTRAMGYEIKDEAKNRKEIMAWRQTKRGVWWYEREPKKYVVSFYHPARPDRISLLMFYPLIDAD